MAEIKQIGQLLPVALESQAPAKQEYAPPATTEEREFEIALKQEKQLWHLQEEDLKQSLRYVYMLIGLKGQNYPTDIEKQLLHAYIFKNYGGHRPSEIRLAFEMAIQHKLGMRPEDVTCYENFSIAYFSRIMEAYREWSKEQAKRIKEPEVKRELTNEEKIWLTLEYSHYKLTLINKLPVKI